MSVYGTESIQLQWKELSGLLHLAVRVMSTFLFNSFNGMQDQGVDSGPARAGLMHTGADDSSTSLWLSLSLLPEPFPECFGTEKNLAQFPENGGF